MAETDVKAQMPRLLTLMIPAQARTIMLAEDGKGTKNSKIFPKCTQEVRFNRKPSGKELRQEKTVIQPQLMVLRPGSEHKFASKTFLFYS